MFFFLADFSVIKPDFGLFFWSVLIFSLFWFLVGKFAFKPIVSALKDRERDIQGSLDEAKKARQEMANLQAENEKLLAQAREERALILKEAKDTKDAIISEARNKAREDAQKIVANAMLEIENQKKAAVTDLRNQAGVIALDIAGQLLKKELKGNSEQEAFVNSLLKDVKLN